MVNNDATRNAASRDTKPDKEDVSCTDIAQCLKGLGKILIIIIIIIKILVIIIIIKILVIIIIIISTSFHGFRPNFGLFRRLSKTLDDTEECQDVGGFLSGGTVSQLLSWLNFQCARKSQ